MVLRFRVLGNTAPSQWKRTSPGRTPCLAVNTCINIYWNIYKVIYTHILKLVCLHCRFWQILHTSHVTCAYHLHPLLLPQPGRAVGPSPGRRRSQDRLQTRPSARIKVRISVLDLGPRSPRWEIKIWGYTLMFWRLLGNDKTMMFGV